MRFLVLGPLEVRGDDDAVLSLPASKERTVLGCLIARAGAAVSVDSLIDELWGENPPRTAEKTLGTHISRIRRVLAAESSATAITAVGDGYRLEVGDQQIDSHVFEELARQGRHLIETGRADEAVDPLREALELWRGSAYQDLRHTNVGSVEGERLEELRRSAKEDSVDALLDVGDTSAVIADLEAMVREEPLRERRWAQFMLAFYRAGRQAEALQAYNRAREHLVEELGIEPGAELQQLQSAILVQEPLPVRPWSHQPESATRRSEVCPYKGLARFEVTDADFYFGREETVSRAIARLVGGRFLALVGASGSGKSSLLRAGVIHALGEGAVPGSDHWGCALIRPGEHPLRRWHQADDEGGPVRRVVAIDQFEEVFTACRDETERVAFLETIVDAVRSEGSVTVILAMRADYYGRCATYRAFAELLEAGQILVGPMDRRELRRAIELPADRAHLQVEQKLTDALIEATAGRPGGLPLLETSLLELWTRRENGKLTLDGYFRSGGVDGAVARLAEDAFGRLNDEEQSAAKRILLRLAAPGDAVEAVGRQAQLAEFDLDDDPAAAIAFTRLTEARLVTVSDSVAEVAHEALLREWPRLRGWLEDDAQGRRLHRHLADAAHTWEEGGRDDADLYRGARLTAALEWEDDHQRDPNELERVFLAQSRTESEGEAARERRTNRRLRGLLAGVALLLALSLVVGSVALTQRDRAQARGLVADARQLAARSLTEEDFATSLLLARQAVEMDDSPETRSALLSALEREPAAIGAMYPPGAVTGDETEWIRLSHDGGVVATGGARPTVTLFDTTTYRAIDTVALNHATVAADFAPDDRTLAVATDDQRLLSVDARSLTVTASVSTDGGLGTIRYSPSGSQLITTEMGERRSSVVARDPDSLEPVASQPATPQEITGMAFAQDGQTFVTTSLGVCCPDSGQDLGETIEWRTRDLHQITSAAASGSDVVVSPDGRTAFLSGAQGYFSPNGGRLVKLDLRTKKSTASDQAISGHDIGAGLRGIALGPNGSVVTGGDDGNLTVWNGDSLTITDAFGGPTGVQMRSPQVSPDGTTAYSVDINGSVVAWDIEGGRRLLTPFNAGSGTPGYGPWFAISGDGRTLAVPQNNAEKTRGSVLLIDASSLGIERRIPFNRFATGFPEGVAFSPDGKTLAISNGCDTPPECHSDGYAAFFDVSSGDLEGPPLFDAPGPVKGTFDFWAPPAFSPNGSSVAIYGDNGAFLFDSATHQLIRELQKAPVHVNWLQFTPDGRSLVGVTGSGGPGHLIVWDAADGAVISDHVIDGSGLFTQDISQDGTFVATGGESSTAVKLSAFPTGSQIGPLLGGPKSRLCSVDISPSDTLLAAGDERAVYLWDVESGTELGQPLPSRSGFVCAYFKPDENRLYMVSQAGQGEVLDIDQRSWEARACQIAGRTLTRQEWSTLLPDRPYEPACTT